jgi:hypothetical protein
MTVPVKVLVLPGQPVLGTSNWKSIVGECDATANATTYPIEITGDFELAGVCQRDDCRRRRSHTRIVDGAQLHARREWHSVSAERSVRDDDGVRENGSIQNATASRLWMERRLRNSPSISRSTATARNGGSTRRRCS